MAVSIFAGCAFADTLISPAGSYNVFVLNDFTGTSADVQGALAAGGNINVNMYGVGTNLSAADVALFPSGATMVAGGSTTASNGQLYFGNSYASTATLTSWNIPNGSSFTGGPSPVDFATATTQLDTISSTLSGMASTPGDACTVSSGTVTCNASADGLNIINIADPSIFDGNSINITASGSNVTLVINVPGASDNFGGGSFTAFMNGATVLFNYYEATTVQLAGSFNTSLLAPLATVSETTSGYFNGTFIANNYGGGQMEFHNTLFSGKVPDSVPEPASVALIGAGLLLIGWRARRRLGDRP